MIGTYLTTPTLGTPLTERGTYFIGTLFMMLFLESVIESGESRKIGMRRHSRGVIHKILSLTHKSPDESIETMANMAAAGAASPLAFNEGPTIKFDYSSEQVDEWNTLVGQLHSPSFSANSSFAARTPSPLEDLDGDDDRGSKCSHNDDGGDDDDRYFVLSDKIISNNVVPPHRFGALSSMGALADPSLATFAQIAKNSTRASFVFSDGSVHNSPVGNDAQLDAMSNGPYHQQQLQQHQEKLERYRNEYLQNLQKEARNTKIMAREAKRLEEIQPVQVLQQQIQQGHPVQLIHRNEFQQQGPSDAAMGFYRRPFFNGMGVMNTPNNNALPNASSSGGHHPMISPQPSVQISNCQLILPSSVQLPIHPMFHNGFMNCNNYVMSNNALPFVAHCDNIPSNNAIQFFPTIDAGNGPNEAMTAAGRELKAEKPLPRKLDYTDYSIVDEQDLQLLDENATLLPSPTSMEEAKAREKLKGMAYAYGPTRKNQGGVRMPFPNKVCGLRYIALFFVKHFNSWLNVSLWHE